jgi:hypothetical protein
MPSRRAKIGVIVSTTLRNACCSSGAARFVGEPSVVTATVPRPTIATSPASNA